MLCRILSINFLEIKIFQKIFEGKSTKENLGIRGWGWGRGISVLKKGEFEIKIFFR